MKFGPQFFIVTEIKPFQNSEILSLFGDPDSLPVKKHYSVSHWKINPKLTPFVSPGRVTCDISQKPSPDLLAAN